MKIIIDSDPKLDFEINSPFRKTFNFFFIPILNLLPTSSKYLIRKSHKSVDEVIENATTHAALEVLYKKGHKYHTKDFLNKFFHGIWFNINNSKAVRNRLKIVRRELTNLIKTYSGINDQILITSIASGSARAVIESLTNAEIPVNVIVSSTFIDKDPKALFYSKDLLNSTSLVNMPNIRFEWVNGTAGSFLRSVKKNNFDIVEMVGLLDYFNDEKAINIFSNIHQSLKVGGTLITANVSPNNEQRFLTNAIGWKMVYRSAEELSQILIKSGFDKSKINIIYEPLRVHCIAIAQK